MSQQKQVYDFLPEKSRGLKEKVITYCQSIQVVEIKTRSQYDGAVATAKDLNRYYKALEKHRVKDKAPYLERGKLVDSYYKDLASELDILKTKLLKAIRVFDAEQEKIRKEEQRKAAEAARIRREAEEKKAEEERLKAEKLREQGQEAKAENLEAKANQREEEAAQTVIPVVEKEAPKNTGISTVRKWKGEVTDPLKFVEEMVKQNRLEFLQPNPVAFNKFATVIKRAWNFPGGRVYLHESSSIRG